MDLRATAYPPAAVSREGKESHGVRCCSSFRSGKAHDPHRDGGALEDIHPKGLMKAAPDVSYLVLGIDQLWESRRVDRRRNSGESIDEGTQKEVRWQSECPWLQASQR